MEDADNLERLATRFIDTRPMSHSQRMELQAEVRSLSNQLQYIKDRFRSIIKDEVAQSVEQARNTRDEQALFLRFCFIRQFVFPDPEVQPQAHPTGDGGAF